MTGFAGSSLRAGRSGIAAALGAAFLILGACGSAADAPDSASEALRSAAANGARTSAADCSSGERSDPNESEGPEMMPGRACTSCHAQSNAASGEGDAPIFAFAGTLFPSAHEPDDCFDSRAEGAVVTVEDVAGRLFSATANGSGNFFLETLDFKAPFTAVVRFQGRQRRMVGLQGPGDCNECHSAAGHRGAPGRILLP